MTEPEDKNECIVRKHEQTNFHSVFFLYRLHNKTY